MGRKATPTHLKIVQGNPGKRALPKREPKPAGPLPPPPAALNDDGLREWRRLTTELLSVKLTTALDWQALASYCVAHQIWVDAVEQVKTRGSMVKSPKGFPLQNPYLAVVNKQTELMHKIGGEFGLTPSARARIGAAFDAAASDEDVGAQFFG